MTQEAEIQSDPIEQPAIKNPPQEIHAPELSVATPPPETKSEQQQPTLESQPIEPISAPSKPQPQESAQSAQPEPLAIPETPPPSVEMQTTKTLATELPRPTPTSPPPQPAEIAQQPSEPARLHPRSLLQRAREKIQFRKRARQEKIVALAVKKRFITNDDVEKLLRVSDATATRYLAELVRQGRLKRLGATRDTRFELH